MLNRKTALLAAAVAAVIIVAASGTLAVLAHANASAHRAPPLQASTIDSIPTVKDLPELKIENLF